MGDTSIEWTRGDDGALGKTWNPIRGCSRVSDGCLNCYAERQAARYSGVDKNGKTQPYRGLARFNANGDPRWTGKVRMVNEHLADPLRWRRPRRVFVNSMSDLFHERLSNEDIAAVFGVMAACPDHTFQCLTKRAERMRDWFKWFAAEGHWRVAFHRHTPPALVRGGWNVYGIVDQQTWPLSNVHLGVSAENQETANERIPYLLQCPAVVRWVSAEPLLGRIRFSYVPGFKAGGAGVEQLRNFWVVAGGESGPGARPCDVEWIRDIVRQCKVASVPVFVKQLGSDIVTSNLAGEIDKWPFLHAVVDEGKVPRIKLRHRKGGDPKEWSEDLRIQEFPRVAA